MDEALICESKCGRVGAQIYHIMSLMSTVNEHDKFSYS